MRNEHAHWLSQGLVGVSDAGNPDLGSRTGPDGVLSVFNAVGSEKLSPSYSLFPFTRLTFLAHPCPALPGLAHGSCLGAFAQAGRRLGQSRIHRSQAWATDLGRPEICSLSPFDEFLHPP